MSFYTPVADIPQIVNATRATFRSGKTQPVEFRKRQLRQFLKLIHENKQAIIDAGFKDLHKPSFEMIAHEMDMVLGDLADHLNHIDEWVKPQHPSVPLAFAMDGPQIRAEALGVVLIIGAWNYPIQLTLVPMVGAISAGNAVIVKPSEVSSATAILLAELIPRYLDPEAYRVINGAVTETSKLLEQKFDKIIYTGNGMVGRVVMEAAAKHLTPVILELGGKSPVIIDRNVNISVAARRIAWGRFINCGQTCVAPDYILIHKDQQASLIKELDAAIKEYYGEDPQKNPDYARVVNERHWQRVSDLITKSGGKVVIGGKTDKADRYIAPTVLTDCDAKSSVLNDEIFGPVLPIVNVDSVDEAIQYVNARDKPLALYVFSNNSSVCNHVINSCSSGSAVVNDCLMQCAVSALPFGGVGPSGMGAYHGKHSFDAFSHQKSILFKNLALEAVNGMRYPPYSARKLSILETLVVETVHGPIRKALTGPFRFAIFALFLAIFYRFYTQH